MFHLLVGRLARSQVQRLMVPLLSKLLARGSAQCQAAVLRADVLRDLVYKLGLPAFVDSVLPPMLQLLASLQHSSDADASMTSQVRRFANLAACVCQLPMLQPILQSAAMPIIEFPFKPNGRLIIMQAFLRLGTAL